VIRYDWRVWVLVVAMTLILAGLALAADYPCPPKFYTCQMVRKVVSEHGEGPVVAHARACGWTDRQIETALRCVRK